MPAIPLPAQRVAAIKPWYERLPVRTRKIILAAAAGVIALILLTSAVQWYHHSQPMYVLEMLDRMDSPAEVQQRREYLTAQGEEIILWILAKQAGKPSSGEHWDFSAPVIKGNICELPVRSGNTTAKFRLVKTDHWRFDDIYLDTSEGIKIGLYVSYIKDHPLTWWMHVRNGKVLVAFLRGLLFGLSGGR